MYSFSRTRNACILTAIVILIGSVIDGFVDMGWEDTLMSSYFLFGTLFVMYLLSPFIIRLFGLSE